MVNNLYFWLCICAACLCFGYIVTALYYRKKIREKPPVEPNVSGDLVLNIPKEGPSEIYLKLYAAPEELADEAEVTFLVITHRE